MSIISEFCASVREVVSFGSKLQREQRKEIQTVVGALADELTRSIDLLRIYLDGIRASDFRHRLVPYLRDSGSKLLTSFHEFEVCTGLYELKDRFKGLFDPVGAAVSMDNKSTIIRLIEDLARGERKILDDMDETFSVLRDFADRLDVARDEQEECVVKSDLLGEIRAMKVELGNKKENIKNTARAIIDNL